MKVKNAAVSDDIFNNSSNLINWKLSQPQVSFFITIKIFSTEFVTHYTLEYKDEF